uniref:Uncharacterized protein n=1 Tax=Wuchereria bancrofti TaxID=6293 RepID=A0A1I8ENY3_WUCBA
ISFTIGRRILKEVSVKSLGGHIFESSNSKQFSSSLLAIIRNRLKGIQKYLISFFIERKEAYTAKQLNLPKYKIILGEKRRQRISINIRCIPPLISNL